MSPPFFFDSGAVVSRNGRVHCPLRVSGPLLDPIAMRVIRSRREEDRPCAQMDKNETVGPPDPQWRAHRLGKEVTGHQRVHVQSQELSPGHFSSPSPAGGGRRQPCILKAYGGPMIGPPADAASATPR